MNSKENAQKVYRRESMWETEWIDFASALAMDPCGVDHSYSLGK